MLVLSRKQGESIQISDTIEVKILELRGKTVRIGIRAPKEFPIHRPDSKVKAS